MESFEFSDDELAGARPYSTALLHTYDSVLWFNNTFVWRCPTQRLLDLYSKHISDDHLDIGPGSGWHLQHVRFRGPHPRVTLVDLSQDSLEMSRRRLRDRGIVARVLRGSVLQPLPVDHRYSSIAASLLMHCVPGDIATKGAAAFTHIADKLTDDGVFFGATVLSAADPAVPHTTLSRATAAAFNRLRVFDNDHDDLAGLRAALGQAFGTVEIDTIGSVALWAASRPGRDTAAGPPTPGPR